MRTLLITIAFGLATLCRADTITINFTEEALAGNPGTELDFVGTVTDNDPTDTVYINADSFTFEIPGALDDSQFLNNAPISVGPGATSTSFQLFDVVIPANETPGIYSGVFTIQGGIGEADQFDTNTVLGSAAFQVDVTPEPVSLPFVAAAIGGLWYVLRRRSRIARTISE
jgi:hypothetical protein